MKRMYGTFLIDKNLRTTYGSIELAYVYICVLFSAYVYIWVCVSVRVYMSIELA